MWRQLLIATAAVALGASAMAETTASGAPAQAAGGAASWDDSHMRSRYQETPRANRPRLVGDSGYGALAKGTAEPSATEVAELEFTTQRQWEQGELSSSGGSARDESSATSGRSGGISRGSALRAAAQSGRRPR